MSEKKQPKPHEAGANREKHSGTGRTSPPLRTGTGRQQDVLGSEHDQTQLVPGEVLYGHGAVVINAGKDPVKLRVKNIADRPIQVGSHYHFAEANPGLDFDRDAAWGRRLNVLAGGSIRFEPGAVEEVELIPIGGQRIVAGLRGECGGKLDDRD